MTIPGVSPLRSIDPSDTEFSDLAPIAAAIEGAQIVLLGEQTHHDGAAFDAKVRILKYLHEELGFDYLAWECGTFEMERMDGFLSEGAEARTALSELFGIWHCTSVLELLEYTRASHATEAPLHHIGFDPQISSLQSLETLTQKVTGLAGQLGVELTADDTAMLAATIGALREQPGTVGGPSFEPAMELLARLVEASAADRSLIGAFQERLLANVHKSFELRTIARELEAGALKDAARDQLSMSPETMEVVHRMNLVRDKAMGENLVWLATEVFPGKKIAGWLATSHGATNLKGTPHPQGIFDHTWTMTDVAKQLMPEGAIYSIGFNAFTGRMGLPGAGPEGVEIPAVDKDGSLEDLLNNEGHALAFADLKGLAPDHPFAGKKTGRLLGYTPIELDWPKAVDGLIFVRETYPPTRDLG